MYQHAYGVIPGCSPHAFAPCQRRILDNFATPAECSDLIEATEMAMENLFHQGDQTSIAPASSGKRLGLRGSLLFRCAAKFLPPFSGCLMRLFALASCSRKLFVATAGICC